jgi:tetratricopeptide (TPR) repeat protein
MNAFELPPPPSNLISAVKAWSQLVVIPTYMPAHPDKNPMFLENRVYQGSNGKVYPLPFTDRIATEKTERTWQALHIENEFLRVMILPELGGRIHVALDKTNGYELIYRQNVIKPALVGLAGPWISGGIEFNWPQHHRPATFLPVDYAIEEHPDGSKTVWCSDHDPMCRMKGMHGVCLHPGDATIELKVRIFNRTPWVQTFLWWANVATRVHEAYQSFFPSDVYYMADHARRSTSNYPLADGAYYGVDYKTRGRMGVPKNDHPSQFVPNHCRSGDGINNGKVPDYAPNDLRFYANIPTPCSYMCMESSGDFFGGYDYFAQAGIIHVANHHIAPGKKQWTWGNHEFGYAWDRNLTDPDAKGEYGPYIEIMAGVYTDNQPDFSFLYPGETKTWSQFWCPIQKIGPVHNANREIAVVLRLNNHRTNPTVTVGAAATRSIAGARVELACGKQLLLECKCDIAPGEPLLQDISVQQSLKESDLRLRIFDPDNRELIAYQPALRKDSRAAAPATEPLSPEMIVGTDELFITGLHLQQYRHATRSPTLYWQEALRRDPFDSRSNNAMGLWRLRRGELTQAQQHFERAIERLTSRNPNPYDSEPFYNLGLCLLFQHDWATEPSPAILEAAYAAFYKATWTQPCAAAGYYALAQIDCRRTQWSLALDHLDRSCRLNADNLSTRNLKVMVLRKLNQADQNVLDEIRKIDHLDWWSRWLAGEPLQCDTQTKLDLVHDLARAGLFRDAIDMLQSHSADSTGWPDQSWGTKPLIHYTLGWLHHKVADVESARAELERAASLPSDYCFPARLEEIGVLQTAINASPHDAKAPYYLGNLLYDRRRHEDAIQLWERSAKLDPSFSIVWRNLGIGYFNIRKSPAKARAAYDKAFQAAPADARLLYERDQLWKRMRVAPAKRFRALEKNLHLVKSRDDLSLEYSTLLNQLRKPQQALAILESRQFQPWEGGEGGPLGQFVRAHLAIGLTALMADDAAVAVKNFQAAFDSPRNLGEAKHLLANRSDAHYWLAHALAKAGDRRSARKHWKLAADFKGDFQEMSVRTFSEMTYYSAISMTRLARRESARKLLKQLLAYAQDLSKSSARIDYFATSLPTMLLFDDDLDFRQKTTALFLEAQAWLGLRKFKKAKSLLASVLRRDPNHALAADLVGELETARRV